MFGNDTGVSLHGQVLLNSGEVRHNWLDVSKFRLENFNSVLKPISFIEIYTNRMIQEC